MGDSPLDDVDDDLLPYSKTESFLDGSRSLMSNVVALLAAGILAIAIIAVVAAITFAIGVLMGWASVGIMEAVFGVEIGTTLTAVVAAIGGTVALIS